MVFILQDGFCFVCVPFSYIIKFQFLAQFPVDHISLSVVSGLIFLLCYLAAFVYYAINDFVTITT